MATGILAADMPKKNAFFSRKSPEIVFNLTTVFLNTERPQLSNEKSGRNERIQRNLFLNTPLEQQPTSSARIQILRPVLRMVSKGDESR